MTDSDLAKVVDQKYSRNDSDLLNSTISSRVLSDGNSPQKYFARNPISTRLYKILGATYTSSSTRDALITVSNYYRNPTIDHKVDLLKANEEDKNYQDENNNGPEFGESSNSSSLTVSLSSGTAARARETLRKDVELKISQGSHAFLKAFKDVDKKLEILQEHVDSMLSKCNEATAELEATNAACNLLLDRAGGLRTLRHSVLDRQTIVNSFLECFTLTAEESDIISSREIPVNSLFFRAMERTEKIRDDCRILMSGDDGPTKSGLDVMAMTSEHLERGFEKLARWCSAELRFLAREVQLEVGPIVQEAVRWLKKRPELLTDVFSALSQMRQATILNAFMTALTRGGPNGLPRPIEMHAHDPLRYIGDIMAWVHQSIASERESLEVLLSLKADDRMVGSVRVFEGGEEEEWIQQLMNSIFERLCSPLKTRVRLTVRSQESCVITFKLANMLQFYKVTMSRTIGETATLSLALNEINGEAYRTFTDLLTAQSQILTQMVLPDVKDEEAPLVVKEYIQSLKELMAVYESSLFGDEDALQQQTGFEPVLQITINAALDLCSRVADKNFKISWDKDIFHLNCFTYISLELETYSFAEFQVKILQEEISRLREQLIKHHYNSIISESGLQSCILICQSDSQNEPLSRTGSMQPSKLTHALSQFSNWLSSSEVVRSPRLSSLIDGRLGNDIHQSALESLVKAYEQICTQVRNPENKYEAANSLLGSQRPFGQISTLRQILGLQDGNV